MSLDNITTVENCGTLHACNPCAGEETPIQEGHKVTMKQLLEWHGRQSELSREESNHVPLVVQRAVPGLDATHFQFLRERMHFLLRWAYVKEKPALHLLRNALEVRLRLFL